MEDVKIRNVKPEDLDIAADAAKHFIAEYPDRKGVYHGVGYSKSGLPSFYVYRMKKTVIVVGQ